MTEMAKHPPVAVTCGTTSPSDRAGGIPRSKGSNEGSAASLSCEDAVTSLEVRSLVVGRLLLAGKVGVDGTLSPEIAVDVTRVALLGVPTVCRGPGAGFVADWWAAVGCRDRFGRGESDISSPTWEVFRKRRIKHVYSS